MEKRDQTDEWELLDSDMKIGNIRDYDHNFRELWISKRNKEICDWISNSRCYCTHECNVHCNTAFSLKHFSRTTAGVGKRKVSKIFKGSSNSED